MGKLIASPTGNVTIRLQDGSLFRIEKGKAVTLTDAEYASADAATVAALPSPTTVADPVRVVYTPNAPIKVPVVTTALRPTAYSVGVGAQLYDITLGIPIWSNGLVWKNAAGTTV